MPNLPKIVSERLRMSTPAVDHPEADVLTAFSECSLPDPERATVLEHLARCSECREIIALALPNAEPAAGAPKPAPAGWLAWPALRWGFAVAGIAVIASLGVLQYRRQVHPSMLASQPSSAPATTAEARNQPQPEAQPMSVTLGSAKDRDKLEAARASASTDAMVAEKADARAAERLARAEEPAVPERKAGGAAGVSGGFFPHGPKMNLAQQNANANQSNAYSYQVPSAPALSNSKQLEIHGAVTTNEAVAVPSSAPVLAQSGRTVTKLQSLQSQRPDQQPSDTGYGQPKAESPRPAGTTIIARAKVPAGFAPSPPVNGAGTVGGVLAAANARWAINSTGGLQRSFDQGNTWQDVNVNGAPALVADAASIDLAKTSRAKEMDKEAVDEKTAKKKDASLVFRAVAAIGTEVWAGASSGLLYHSTDAGGHWMHVVPTSAAAVLTGDILTVEFSDAQHGKVTTSTSEIWITTDGGLTWQRLQ